MSAEHNILKFLQACHSLGVKKVREGSSCTCMNWHKSIQCYVIVEYLVVLDTYIHTHSYICMYISV